ncbi:MAG: hypothetical protein Q8K99_02320 [Actinomycetota bacterium]|nr:hypothetical protein [Actinomycetota bacterium]
MSDTYTISTLYDRLTARGFKPSKDAQRIYGAMTTCRTPDAILGDARSELRAALLAGDQDATDAAQAAVSAASNVRASWESFEAMRREYADELSGVIGEPAFTFVRGLYDAAGSALTAALATVDPDTAPDTVMVDGSKAEREAWVSVPGIVAELDDLAVLLGDVVKRMGRSSYCQNYRSVKDVKYVAYPLGLFVTVGSAHPRRLAEAWCWTYQPPRHVNPTPPTPLDTISGGRGGKWAALVRLGGVLASPCESLATYAPFDLAPLTRGVSGVIDPHDGPAQMAAYKRHVAVAVSTTLSP